MGCYLLTVYRFTLTRSQFASNGKWRGSRCPNAHGQASGVSASTNWNRLIKRHAVCIVYVWRSQQGWTGPWRSWDDRSGLRNKPSHVHWKEHIDPLPGSDLYLTFCELTWANGWKLCKSPRAPNTQTRSSVLSVCSGTCSTALGCKSGRADIKIHSARCFGYCLLPLFKCFGNTPPSHPELFHIGFLI